MLSNSNEETDQKLAAWLKKILPALEKELADGPTPVYHKDHSRSTDKSLKIEEYQDIDLKHHFSHLKNFSEDELTKGAATWLSVSTQDSPVLVASLSSKSEDQKLSLIVVFEPRRSKTDAKIYWHELISIPVKESIDFLTTNPQNRDMFAGASTAGDLYIWSYHNMPSVENESRVTELFSKALEDSIVALTFLSSNRLLCCLSDGKIIVYKVVSKQSTIIDKVMKIEPRNVKDPIITTVVAVLEDDFVVGLFDGSILYCSTNQLMPQDGTFNPIVRELQPHKFTITSLRHCHHNVKSYIISCDSSGEVFFNEVEDTFDKQPKLVIKLPLPLKFSITSTSNMEHIFSPLEKGSLEVFKTNDNARETLFEGKLGGYGSVVELSRNE